MRKKRRNNRLIVCPRTKQFTDIVVCAASCQNRCAVYRETITIDMLLKFIEEHPEYEIIGEIMPVKTKATVKETRYWILDDQNVVQEVNEKEIMKNPQDFLNKQIFQKPPFKYDLVITLKRVKVED
ncbi:MAG: hypothetical protein APR54_02715 [Candidatus Cloacimonas sp. SDB]|nr:MAG: hypothetical protein APR54_02715 [Candidatus Cloacimonas sp. SDB]